ncbi:hypothetical protein, partial [Labilibacter marinus]|uniref:hypothetical protein n=1 Tax=Labilibacter marinus TaxID=1477105 RepID=UPI001E478475
ILYLNILFVLAINQNKQTMGLEEFYWKYKRIDDRFREAERIAGLYRNEMSKELFDLAVNNHLELKNRLNILKEPLLKLTEEATQEVFECFDYALWAQKNNKENKEESTVPKPQTKQEAELKLQKELESLPAECREEYPPFFWELYEQRLKESIYKDAVYKAMKKVFVKYYQDDILELDGTHLRRLAVNIYYSCACCFINDVYELVD